MSPEPPGAKRFQMQNGAVLCARLEIGVRKRRRIPGVCGVRYTLRNTNWREVWGWEVFSVQCSGFRSRPVSSMVELTSTRHREPRAWRSAEFKGGKEPRRTGTISVPPWF